MEVGPQGFKGFLTALQAVAVEEDRPQEAQALAEVVEAIEEDDWFERYLAEPRDPSPFVRAVRLQEAYRRHLREHGKDS